MKSFFNPLFDYNFLCNKNLIEKCMDLREVPEKEQSLFSHDLNAHHIWNMRLLGKEATYSVWEEHSLSNWGDIHYENQRATFDTITNKENFEKRIDYEITEGRVYINGIKRHLI